MTNGTRGWAGATRSRDDEGVSPAWAGCGRAPVGGEPVPAGARVRADAIHANPAGYARFAQVLLKTLRETGLFAG